MLFASRAFTVRVLALACLFLLFAAALGPLLAIYLLHEPERAVIVSDDGTVTIARLQRFQEALGLPKIAAGQAARAMLDRTPDGIEDNDAIDLMFSRTAKDKLAEFLKSQAAVFREYGYHQKVGDRGDGDRRRPGRQLPGAGHRTADPGRRFQRGAQARPAQLHPGPLFLPQRKRGHQPAVSPRSMELRLQRIAVMVALLASAGARAEPTAMPDGTPPLGVMRKAILEDSKPYEVADWRRAHDDSHARPHRGLRGQ